MDKNVMLMILAVGVVAMTVAFAALSTNLRISGTASIPNVNWNIHFDNWREDTASTVTTSNGTQQNTASYPSVAQLQKSLSPNVTLVEGINITLYQPNDYAKYTFDIVNDGTIDAKLDNFTHTMTCESGKNCDFLEYTVECKDSSLNTVTENTVLTKNGGRVNCYLQLKFKDVDNLGANTTNNANKTQASIVNGVYTQEATSASLAANWAWIQNSEQQAQGGNSGGNEPVTPSNPYQTSFGGTYGYDYDGAETSGNGGSTEWVSSLDPNVITYLRSNGSKYEACGVFPNGTACMTSPAYNSNYSSAGNYHSDFEDVSTDTYDITTAAGLEATGLKGYSLAKAEEMLNKGASSCDVSNQQTFSCNLNLIGGEYCYLDSSHVLCYDGMDWAIDDGGCASGHC